MKRRILAGAAAALAAFAAPATASTCESLSLLEGLLGNWNGAGPRPGFRETWRAVGPATWEGRSSETLAAGGDANAEDLRLVEMGGSVFYLAKVSRNERPVAFRLVECAGGRFTFENASHDFPRRIEYRLGAVDRLTIEVSDGAGQDFTLELTRDAAAEGDEAALLRAEDVRFAAMVAGDVERMRSTFADDLAYVHSTGEVQDREGLISTITSGKLRYFALEPEDRKVVWSGPDAACVLGRGRIGVEAGGRSADFQARYLAIYGRIGGVWRLRAWQSLRLP